eukprot:20515-Heterococcus_DN1.PRE.1
MLKRMEYSKYLDIAWVLVTSELYLAQVWYMLVPVFCILSALNGFFNMHICAQNSILIVDSPPHQQHCLIPLWYHVHVAVSLQQWLCVCAASSVSNCLRRVQGCAYRHELYGNAQCSVAKQHIYRVATKSAPTAHLHAELLFSQHVALHVPAIARACSRKKRFQRVHI